MIGTAGVPIAIALVAACGRATDEISLAILGNTVTADGYRRMTDIGAVLSVGTAGGFVLMAVALGLIALFSLYFVMLLREVALLAFVVFAPVALLSRRWLRRWVEVIGALLFSKIAMAIVFTLGVSAMGVKDAGSASIGTFLTGVLLMAIAALTPMVTFNFIHWAGDQGHAAVQAMQQGARGVAAGRDHVQEARVWGAEHFGAQDNDAAGIDDQVDIEPGDRAGTSRGTEDAGDDNSVAPGTATQQNAADSNGEFGGQSSDTSAPATAMASASVSVDGRASDHASTGSSAEATEHTDRAPDDGPSDAPRSR